MFFWLILFLGLQSHMTLCGMVYLASMLSFRSFLSSYTLSHTIVLQKCSWLVFIDISGTCIVLEAERLPAVSGAKRSQLAGGLTLGGGLRQLHRTPCSCTKPAFVLPLWCCCSRMFCAKLYCAVLFSAVVRSALVLLLVCAMLHTVDTMTCRPRPELRGGWRGSAKGQWCFSLPDLSQL